MGIYYDDIKARMEKLTDTLEYCGNCALKSDEKVGLSEQLAELTLMIRLKYGLVSAYYTPAEHKAEKIVDKMWDDGGFCNAPGMFADEGD